MDPVLHEPWLEPDNEGDALSFFPVGPHVEQSRSQLPPSATLIWTVHARGWTEAMALYEHMGWEPYQPVDDLPEETYADLGWE